MAKSTIALQQAFKTLEPVQEKPAPTEALRGYKAPSREGTVPISVYLPADFKRSLRLVQAQDGQSLQAIVAEALNDFFAKRRVPTVQVPEKKKS